MSAAIKNMPVPEESNDEPASIVPFPDVSEAAKDEAGSDDEDLRDLETEGERLIRHSLYHEIKQKLVARGIPEHEIAFIHSADTPAKKAKLFDDVNAGRVRVLLGSTSKMGVAMNAQERMIALHHLDAPWRPRDVEQREGRLIRQGNIFDEVFVFQYVTKGSMDCYTWQILESKAKFIHQIMSGEVTQRTAEDIGDMVLTAAQVKAVASGNPKVMERVRLEINLTRLERLRAAYYNNRSAMRFEISYLPNMVAAAQGEIEWHRQALSRRRQLSEGEFAIRLKQNRQTDELSTFNKRQEAGRALRHLGDLAYDAVRRASPGSVVHEEVGEYRGFRVYVHASNPNSTSLFTSLFSAHVEIQLRAEAESRPYIASITDTDTGITQSMDHQLRTIEDHLAEASAKKLRLDKKLADLQAEVNRPWKHLAEYRKMRRRYERLAAELQDAGVAAGTGVAFSSLNEEELEGPDEAFEEAEEETGATTSIYTMEAGARNSLTGLETDPIIATKDPRYTLAARVQTATSSHDLQGDTADPGQKDIVAQALTHGINEACLNTKEPEAEASEVKTPPPLFGSLPAVKTSKAKRARRRTPNPNQIGFGWLEEAPAAVIRPALM